MIDIRAVEEKAKQYAESVRGLNHRKTAAPDFVKGAEFVLSAFDYKWRDATKELPAYNTRVLVKKEGRFVNIGILVFDDGKKGGNKWLCGNSVRNWDIDYWMPLPE